MNAEPGTIISRENNSYQRSIERLTKSDPANVQQIAASQIELLGNYHQEVLSQAQKSFRWALVAAGIGLLFFLVSVVVIVFFQDDVRRDLAFVSTLGGTLIEVISAINFFLYGRVALQMAEFQQRLDRTQRFLLANSICEGLDNETKQRVRSELVRIIAGIELTGVSKITQDTQKNMEVQ